MIKASKKNKDASKLASLASSAHPGASSQARSQNTKNLDVLLPK